MANNSCNLSLHVDSVGLTYIYSLSFSLGLPANLLSLWGLYQLGRSGGGVQMVCLLNLLLSDLLQLLTLPLWMMYVRAEHKWQYSRLACDFVGFVFYVNLYASVAFLCFIALDRYLAIVHPLASRGIRTVRVAVLSGLAIWTLTFLFCLTGLYPTVFDQVTQHCLEKYPVSTRYAGFKIGTIVLGFLLPCGVLGYTSTRIGMTLHTSPSISDHDRRKIIGTLFIITLIFFLVFGPYHLLGCYKFVAYFLTADRCGLERSLFLPYRLCYGLTSLNNLLDPLFYIFASNNIRQELRSIPCVRTGSDSNKEDPCNRHPELEDCM